MVGRPIRNGADLCTPDPNLTAPCVQNNRLLSESPGVVEADIIQSVFTELRLRGVVISEDPTPRIIAREIARERLLRCKTRYQEQLALANRITNSKARTQVVAALPKCDDLVAQPAVAHDHGRDQAPGAANTGAGAVQRNTAAGGTAIQAAP